jgi:hypothetical protein
LEQHLHAEQRFVVVADGRFEISIFDANIAIVAFDVRNSELIGNL